MNLGDALFNLALGVAASVVVAVTAVVWHKMLAPQINGRRSISRGKKRQNSWAEGNMTGLICDESECEQCLECAAGCLTLILLDQYREADDVGTYRLARQSWGWGDSMFRNLGDALDSEISRKRQPSPSCTSLALETLADVWPGLAEMGLGTSFPPMRMGLYSLLNRESMDGRIDSIKGAGTVSAQEMSGTIRHSAIGGTALLSYAEKSPELIERATVAMHFVIDELERDPWRKLSSSELIPVSMGLVRRALFSFASSNVVDAQTRRSCLKAIGRHDLQMTSYMRRLVTGTQAADWAGRPSWVMLQMPDNYLNRCSGPDSMPESVMEFLLWSPVNDREAMATLERMVDLATQRDDGGGVSLFGYQSPDVGSSIMMLAMMESSKNSVRLYERSIKLVRTKTKLFRFIIEDFWRPEQQQRMWLENWLCLLRLLLRCPRVAATLKYIDTLTYDKKVEALRAGRPHLYHPVDPATLDRVREITQWCLFSSKREK